MHTSVQTGNGQYKRRRARDDDPLIVESDGEGEEGYYEWDKERGEAIRPFRLWDAQNKCNLRWRNYADKKRAHLAALIECRWQPVGATIEVYDCRTGRLLGQYTRRVDSIRFTE